MEGAPRALAGALAAPRRPVVTMTRGQKLVLRIVQAGISVAVLVAVAASIDLGQLVPALRRSAPSAVVLVCLLYFASAALHIFKLFVIINQHEQRLSLWRVTLLSYAGAAVGFLAPGVTGDLAQSYFGVVYYGMRGGAVSAVLADKITALSVLLVLAAAPLWIDVAPALGGASLAAGLVLGAVVVWPAFLPWRPVAFLFGRLTGRPTTSEELARACTLRGARAALAFGLSALSWGLTAAQFLVAARAVGLDASPLAVIIAVPIVSVARVLPISLNGLGVQEASLVVFLSGAGQSVESAAMAVLLRVFNSLPAGLIGVAALAALAHRGPAEPPADRSDGAPER